MAELTILAPTEGETVPPVHDVAGINAEPDAEVKLFSGDRDPEIDEPNATEQANGDGNWTFNGSTPAAVGAITWTVISGGSTASVNVTVAEGAPEPGPTPGEPGYIPDTPEEGASPNTEAERAEYHAPEPPDVYQIANPVQFTPATKSGVPRPHTPEPEELPTTNAHEDGGLPTNPREPYPTGSGPRNAGSIKGT